MYVDEREIMFVVSIVLGRGRGGEMGWDML